MTELEPARLWRRLVARLCDTTCLVAATALVTAVIGAGAVGVGMWSTAGESSSDFLGADFLVGVYLLMALFVLAIPSALVLWFVYECVLARRSGQTPGKRLLSLRVTAHGSRDSGPVGIDRLAARWMTLQLPAAILLVAGWLAWPSGDRKQMLTALAWLLVVTLPTVLSRSGRGVHDWVAGTVVVRACQRPGADAECADAAEPSASAVRGSANQGAGWR